MNMVIINLNCKGSFLIMKYGLALLVFSVFFPHLCLAQQNERGVSIQPEEIDIVNYKAIVIGVSSYKNLPKTLQLDFARKDAENLAQALSDIGCITKGNLISYYDSSAKKYEIERMLKNTLIRQAKAGDMVIIYFAGHGNVEAEVFDDGFLLLHNAPNDGDYFMNDGVLDLKDIRLLAEAAAKNGVNVFLITDACRSGKLIDGTGAQNTNKVLNNDWGKVIKLVSCGENESSYEGTQWGGGHGAFSYYLIYGLSGLADLDRNGIIEYYELKEFVERNVKEDTKFKQIPEGTCRDKHFAIVKVDTLIRAKAEKSFRKIEAVDKKGRGINCVNDTVNMERMMNILQEYITRNNFIDPDFYINDDGSKPSIINCIPITGSKSCQNSLGIINSDKAFATLDQNNMITIWSLKDKKIIKEITTNEEVVKFLIHPNSESLLVYDKENTLSIWDLNQGKVINKLKNYIIRDFKFSADGKFLYVAGNDGKLEIRLFKTMELLKSIPIDLGFSIIEINTAGTEIACASNNGIVSIIDLSSFKLRGSYSNNKNSIVSIHYGTNDKVLAFITKNDELNILKSSDLSLIKKKKITGVFSEDFLIKNKYILIPGTNHEIKLYNISNDSIFVIKLDKKTNVKDLCWSNSEHEIAGVYSNCGVFYATYNAPKLFPSAETLYAEIEKNVSDKAEVVNVRDIIISSILSSSQPIVENLLSGKEYPISMSELKKTIDNLTYAYNLNQQDSLYEKTIFSRLAFLRTEFILQKNDVSQYSVAIALMESAAKLDSNAAYPSVVISSIYQKKQDVLNAEKYAAQSIRKAPKWSEPHVSLGNVLLMKNNYDDAAKQFNTVIKNQPYLSKGYSNLAKLYTATGSYKLADDNLKKSIAVDSLNPNLYTLYSNLQYQRGRYKDAEMMLEKCAALDTSNTLYYKYAGELYSKLYNGKYKNMELLKNSETYLKMAIENNSYDPDVYLNLSSFYLKLMEMKNENVEVAKFLFETFKVSSNSDLLKILSQEVKALDEKAKILNPSKVDLFYNQALAAVLSDNPEKAEAYFKESINQEAYSPQPYFNYARFLEKQDKVELAEKMYLKAIEKDKKYLLAYTSLWDLYKTLNKQDKLNELYTLAIKMFPDCPVFYYKKACAGKTLNNEEISKAMKADEMFYSAQYSSANNEFIQTGKTKPDIVSQNFFLVMQRVKKMDESNILVRKDNSYGVMNISGKLILPIDYDTILKINSQQYLAIRKVMVGYSVNPNSCLYWISLNGKLEKVETKYETANFIDDGLINVSIGNSMGCLNLKGDVIIPVEYGFIDHYHSGLIKVMQYDKYGCYNTQGKLIIPIEYESIYQGQDDYCKARKNGKDYQIYNTGVIKPW